MIVSSKYTEVVIDSITPSMVVASMTSDIVRSITTNVAVTTIWWQIVVVISETTIVLLSVIIWVTISMRCIVAAIVFVMSIVCYIIRPRMLINLFVIRKVAWAIWTMRKMSFSGSTRIFNLQCKIFLSTFT